MPNRRKPAYMTEKILMEEARAEVGLLRVKMYHSAGTYAPENVRTFLTDCVYY